MTQIPLNLYNNLPDIAATPLKTYLAIARLANENGCCKSNYDDIGKVAGQTPNVARRSVKTLTDLGLILASKVSKNELLIILSGSKWTFLLEESGRNLTLVLESGSKWTLSGFKSGSNFAFFLSEDCSKLVSEEKSGSNLTLSCSESGSILTLLEKSGSNRTQNKEKSGSKWTLSGIYEGQNFETHIVPRATTSLLSLKKEEESLREEKSGSILTLLKNAKNEPPEQLKLEEGDSSSSSSNSGNGVSCETDTSIENAIKRLENYYNVFYKAPRELAERFDGREFGIIANMVQDWIEDNWLDRQGMSSKMTDWDTFVEMFKKVSQGISMNHAWVMILGLTYEECERIGRETLSKPYSTLKTEIERELNRAKFYRDKLEKCGGRVCVIKALGEFITQCEKSHENLEQERGNEE